MMTMSEMKQKIKQTPTKKDRTEQTTEFVNQLKNKHMGYFNGKKVPFAKNQSYKQSIFNPYSDDRSVITVQVVDYASLNSPDNLTRKHLYHLKNSQYLTTQKLVGADQDLFEQPPGGEVQIQSYGKIIAAPNKHKMGDNISEYTIISFWERIDGRHQVMAPFYIPEALSRLVNSDNGLSETLFQSHNIKLPFMFSKNQQMSNSLVLNLLGRPLELQKLGTQVSKKPTASGARLSRRQSSLATADFTEISGLKKLTIG